jgi:hypothetical protein
MITRRSDCVRFAPFRRVILLLLLARTSVRAKIYRSFGAGFAVLHSARLTYLFAIQTP